MKRWEYKQHGEFVEMSHAATFGSLLGAARSLGIRPSPQQADYDRA